MRPPTAEHLDRAERRACTSFVLACAIALPACASDNDLVLADAALDAQAASAAKALIVARTQDLHAAAVALCAAAPPQGGGGWTEAKDGARIAMMKASWKAARVAFQSVAGVVDMSFPDLGASLDARYEDALAAGPDPDLFDSAGFTGMHAIERVLWADRIPAGVVATESMLQGYAPAAFPADDAEASRFRAGLCARFVADTSALESGVSPLALDSSAAYEAALRLIAKQPQKLIEAGEHRDESRYAGYTLADMKANVASAQATHAVFRVWLWTKAGGVPVDVAIAQGFAQIETEYAAFGSDTLPYVPMDWSASDLTHDALETPFGQLFIAVSNEANAGVDGSLARSMGQAAAVLGISDAR